jgi:hypothetical protein
VTKACVSAACHAPIVTACWLQQWCTARAPAAFLRLPRTPSLSGLTSGASSMGMPDDAASDSTMPAAATAMNAVLQPSMFSASSWMIWRCNVCGVGLG